MKSLCLINTDKNPCLSVSYSLHQYSTLCLRLAITFSKIKNLEPNLFQDALRAMSVVAVVVNSALIGVSGQLTRLIPGLNTVTVIIIIIAFEVSKSLVLFIIMCKNY